MTNETNDAMVTVPLPDTSEVRREITEVEAKAAAMVIDSNETYEAGWEFLKTVAGLKKKVSGLFDPIKKAMNATLDVLRTKEKETAGPLDKAREIMEPKLIAWKKEQDRKAAEERARLEAEARKAAEEQRKRELKALQKEGLKDMAKELKQAPLLVPAVHVAAAPKIEGGSVRTTWKAEVVDLMALVKAVAAGKAPLTYVEPAMPILNKQASSLKGEMKIPGVKAVPKEGLAANTGKTINSW